VVHRDLKPANVMVGAFGEVQVMDWGLAKALTGDRPPEAAAAGDTADALPDSPDTTACEPERGTRPNAVLGTWPYMPPEQARGEASRLDARSDVFGLGAMLCEILTGAPPYTGDNVEEVGRQARTADLARAWARLDGCGADAELVQLAKACLAADQE